jgi:hypothetical protein
MFARGDFALGQSRGLTLPRQAVAMRDGFNHVFLVGADNRVTQTKVEVGYRDAERVEILAGIKPDARVVASGAGFLNDGDLVQVAPPRIQALAPDRPLSCAMNFSALSIRNPIPAILLFALLTWPACWPSGLRHPGFPGHRTAGGHGQRQPARRRPGHPGNRGRPQAGEQHCDPGPDQEDTTILDGEVTISIEFELEKNANEAETEVRAAVSRVRPTCPPTCATRWWPRSSPAGRPGAWTLTSDTLDEEALSWLVDDTVTRRLLAVKGVGAVKRMGGLTRELRGAGRRPHGRPRRQRRRRVAPAAQGPAGGPGGRGDVGGGEQAVRTIATVPAPRPWRPWTSPARRAQRAPRAHRHHHRHHRRAPLGGPARRQAGGRLRGLAHPGRQRDHRAEGVAKAMAELQAAHPELRFTHAYDNVAAVQENFDGSMQLLYEGALLAVLVVWWFLRDWRATLVAALALPCR